MVSRFSGSSKFSCLSYRFLNFLFYIRLPDSISKALESMEVTEIDDFVSVIIEPDLYQELEEKVSRIQRKRLEPFKKLLSQLQANG